MALQIVKPIEISPEAVLIKVKEFASFAMGEYEEAEELSRFLKGQYNVLADLMEQAAKIKQKTAFTAQDKNELENILEVSIEIIESINRAYSEESLTDDAVEVTDEAPELPSKNELAQKFLSVYNKHKARLGLETQADVSALTGLDRRYVSVIESGKMKPQFKTLKKLADAFGIDVSEFVS